MVGIWEIYVWLRGHIRAKDLNLQVKLRSFSSPTSRAVWHFSNLAMIHTLLTPLRQHILVKKIINNVICLIQPSSSMPYNYLLLITVMGILSFFHNGNPYVDKASGYSLAKYAKEYTDNLARSRPEDVPQCLT